MRLSLAVTVSTPPVEGVYPCTQRVLVLLRFAHKALEIIELHCICNSGMLFMLFFNSCFYPGNRGTVEKIATSLLPWKQVMMFVHRDMLLTAT